MINIGIGTSKVFIIMYNLHANEQIIIGGNILLLMVQIAIYLDKDFGMFT
jgi:hypothetical protein